MDIRIGIGFDIHRLVDGRRLVLGGVELESSVGLEGHSDGDVILHAITDAILGAAGLGDIGEHFPDTDPEWKDADSAAFLLHAVKLADQWNLEVGNVDVNVLAERPKLGPAKKEIRRRVAELLGVDADRVNIKARTMEQLGPIGEGQAIGCQAVVLLAGP
ncbi:MAG: 2-C-methyl-D-erythritol 2,4-cyclodiphosphate synthase [Phycisphaerae bacterium]|nr:2-C-methyl-D-erythritol 2,4-cyclodiphosphate synthase [Phycisphaerae bacterium]